MGDQAKSLEACCHFPTYQTRYIYAQETASETRTVQPDGSAEPWLQAQILGMTAILVPQFPVYTGCR